MYDQLTQEALELGERLIAKRQALVYIPHRNETIADAQARQREIARLHEVSKRAIMRYTRRLMAHIERQGQSWPY